MEGERNENKKIILLLVLCALGLFAMTGCKSKEEKAKEKGEKFLEDIIGKAVEDAEKDEAKDAEKEKDKDIKKDKDKDSDEDNDDDSYTVKSDDGIVNIEKDGMTIDTEEGKFTYGAAAKWPTEQPSAILPEFKDGILNTVINSSEYCMITVTDVTMEEYNAYVEKIKDTGFTNNIAEMVSGTGYYFSAEMDEKTSTMIYFVPEEGAMTITLAVEAE